MNIYDSTSTSICHLDFTCTTKELSHLKHAVEEVSPDTDSSLEDRYVGAWHRTFEEGTSLPNSARVIWLQTHKFFADIRIPSGSREKQMSFSGHTVIQGDRCEWHQWCGLSSPDTDSARLEWLDETRIKEFCDDGATELWEKEDKKVERIMSLQLIDEQIIETLTSKYDESKSGKGFFLVVGDDFTRVLGDYEKGDHESYHGKISSSGDWHVSDSTQAASEGQSLYDAPAMQRFGDIILEKVDDTRVRRWLVHELVGEIPTILE